MIRVDKDTSIIRWKYQPVPFNLDGDPDWAAGAIVMSTSCGELIASVQKDGWSYAIDANQGPSCALGGNSWQFPPTTGGCQFTDHSQVHGDDDYRRPGAAWNDVFIVRTGGENLVADGVSAGYGELHALNACAPPSDEQDRVRWLVPNIPNVPSKDEHISYSSPTVTGGIVFIGTRQDPTDPDNAGHLVVFADPSVVPANQQVCSNPDFPLSACFFPYAPVWSLQPLADIPMPDGGSLASMRNEPVLAEGRVFVATSPNDAHPDAGHVYILAPGCSCNFIQNPAVNQLYLGPNTCPIRVAQSGTSQADLVMSGPWVASDHGLNANGVVADKDSLPDGSTINLTPGFEDLGPGGVPRSDGLMGINVSVPASARVGQYCVAVQATDPASRVAAVANVPIEIYACKPLTACPPGACGTFPTGCGGNLECGLCQAGEVCTGGGCCNPFVNVCGKRCPALQIFCPKTSKCADPRLCPSMDCRVVNGITECQ
jgi:hypothetical protein